MTPSRILSDGRHEFRVPLAQLAELHRDATAAAIAGDYSWITRFARDDRELAAIALLFMGNTVGSLRLLETAGRQSPRTELFHALACWAEDPASPEAANVHTVLARHHDLHAVRELSRYVAQPIHSVLFVGGPTDRIGELIGSFEGVRAAMGLPDPETGRLRIERETPDSPQAAFDLVFMDPSHWIPADLFVLPGLKVAYIGDLEWHFFHAPQRYAGFDALVAIGSQGHVEAATRFRRPCFVGPIACHLGLQTVEPAFLDPDTAEAAWRGLTRSHDVVSTGRQRHLAGLYHDKAAFNRALLSLDDSHQIRVHEGFLAPEAYRRTMSAARFVATSHRFGLGQSWRAFEALAVGAMALVDGASGVSSRFSEDFGCIHGVRDDHLAEDMGAHVSSYGAYVDRFAPRAAAFFAELNAVVPPHRTGVAKEVRLLILGTLLARHGLPSPDLRRWQKGVLPGPKRTPAFDTGGGLVSDEPILQSHLLARSVEPWLDRSCAPFSGGTSIADGLSGDDVYPIACDRLALLHVSANLGKTSSDVLVSASLTMLGAFPDHLGPKLLYASALREVGDLARADTLLLGMLAELRSLEIHICDARPEWRLGLLPVAGPIDAVIRDVLGFQRTDDAEDAFANLRRVLASTARTMLADSALRRSENAAAVEFAASALDLSAANSIAGGILLQALWRLCENAQGDQADEALTAAFDTVGRRDQELFHLFAWPVSATFLELGRAEEACRLAAEWLLSWRRLGAPAGNGAVSRWARPAMEVAFRHREVAALPHAGELRRAVHGE